MEEKEGSASGRTRLQARNTAINQSGVVFSCCNCCCYCLCSYNVVACVCATRIIVVVLVY